MSTFTHHPRNSGSVWEFDPSRTYEQNPASRSRLGSSKPRGFWLSVDDDWRRWCNDEEMSWVDADPVMFDLDTDRCLWLKSVSEIDGFHDTYVGDQDGYRINWEPLTLNYAGIIIAPYQWARRLGGGASDWYYGWDCASACVWDLSVLKVSSEALGATA